MSPEFAPLYAQLTESYVRIPPSRWIPDRKPLGTFRRAPGDSISLVVHSIRQSVTELSLTNRLRSDGYHFLVVNMHQMVTLPILSSALASRRPPRSDVEDSRRPDQSVNAMYRQLREDVEHDVTLILSRASEGSEGEISGRAILEATSHVYEQLKTAASNVWG